MSLRARITFLVAVAVAAAITAVAWVAYAQIRSEARAEIDDFLRSQGPIAAVESIVADSRGEGGRGIGPPGGRGGGGPGRGPITRDDVEVQFVLEDGSVVALYQEDTVTLPVSEVDVAIAAGSRRSPSLQDARADGVHYRVLTLPFGDGAAVQIARDLSETDAILADLRLRLWGVGAIGVALAAALGWVVARRAVIPVRQITEAAEHVAATQELDAAIPVERSDELGRLAASFNEMLAGLQEAREQQSRLVADASHELRTPLTSLRTNLELLAREGDLAESDRIDILGDLTGEIAELSSLVSELVELATVGAREEPVEPLDLAEILVEGVERARRRSGHVYDVQVEPTTISGRPQSLHRAIGNLLENAAKWSTPDSEISVVLTDRKISVRDRGPGFDEDDIPHVFERFYRAAGARSMPGSGLGLAIVASVAEAHGATPFAQTHRDGGAVVGIDFSATPAT